MTQTRKSIQALIEIGRKRQANIVDPEKENEKNEWRKCWKQAATLQEVKRLEKELKALLKKNENEEGETEEVFQVQQLIAKIRNLK